MGRPTRGAQGRCHGPYRLPRAATCCSASAATCPHTSRTSTAGSVQPPWAMGTAGSYAAGRPSTISSRPSGVSGAKCRPVAALRLHRGTQAPGAATFPHVPSTKGLRADLKAAGLAYTTEAGTLDLHALRVTFATLLARSGVSLAQAQRLMRHSTPALTANVYTKLRIEDGHAAVARIDGASTKEQRARPT